MTNRHSLHIRDRTNAKLGRQSKTQQKNNAISPNEEPPSPQPTVRILSIPSELRARIYKEVARGLTLRPRASYTQHRKNLIHPWLSVQDKIKSQVLLDLLCINKQIRQEMFKLLWPTVTLDLARYSMTYLKKLGLVQLLDQHNCAAFNQIGHLRLGFGFSIDSNYKRLLRWLEGAKALRSITFCHLRVLLAVPIFSMKKTYKPRSVALSGSAMTAIMRFCQTATRDTLEVFAQGARTDTEEANALRWSKTYGYTWLNWERRLQEVLLRQKLDSKIYFETVLNPFYTSLSDTVNALAVRCDITNGDLKITEVVEPTTREQIYLAPGHSWQIDKWMPRYAAPTSRLQGLQKRMQGLVRRR